jgi:hypothetical protein
MPSPEALDRAAFLLWHHDRPTGREAEKVRQDVWVWLPASYKRPWIEQARVIAAALEER